MGQFLKSRPENAALKIGVHDQLRGDFSIWQFRNDDLKSRLPSVLHGWNTIRVIAYQNDSLDRMIGGIGCNVESYSHVYAFLFEVRAEIGISWRSRRIHWRMFWLEPPEL